MTNKALWCVLVRQDGDHWYLCALGSRCAERTSVMWMTSTRAEALAVGRWLARGIAPSELLIHRRDDSRLRTHRYPRPRRGVRRRREQQWRAATKLIRATSPRLRALARCDVTKPF